MIVVGNYIGCKQWWNTGHGLRFVYVLNVSQIDMFNFFLDRAIDLSSRGEMVAEYLIMQMDPEWTDVDGSTLLHFACR